MKYTTFRSSAVVAALVVVLAGAAAVFFLRGRSATTTAPQQVKIVEVPAATPVTTPAVPTPSAPAIAGADAGSTLPEGAVAFRDVDHDVMRLVQQPAAQDHLKDVTKGKPYKVDLYSDDSKQWRRVKIDLNRNGKWDEKWSWKNGKWRREVSQADDERYDESFVLVNDAWVKQ